MPCPTLEVQIKSFVPLPAWCIGDVTLGTGQTDSIFPGTEMTRRSILLPWTTFTVLLKEAPRNNRTLEQGHEKGQGGWEVSASLWDLQCSAASSHSSVEAVLSGWLEVDVRGFHLFSLRVPYIFESLSFGAHYLVVNVSDQLLGGLSGNQAMND